MKQGILMPAVLICLLMLAGAVSAASITDSLVGYWKFDETTGTTAADSSGKGNDLTLNGATFGTGNKGNGLDLDGSSGYASLADASITGPFPSKTGGNASDFTISAWVKFTDVSNRCPIVSKQGSSTRGICLQKESYSASGNGEQFELEYFDAADTRTELLGTTTPNANEWYHVVATCSLGGTTANLVLYVNGTQEATITGNGPSKENTVDLNIGRYSWAANSTWLLPGVIDNVRIYNRAITSAEVTTLYTDEAASIRFVELGEAVRGSRLEIVPAIEGQAASLRFFLPEAGQTTLGLYDAMGKEVAKVFDARLSAGAHTHTHALPHSAAGVYFYRLLCEAGVATSRVVVAR